MEKVFVSSSVEDTQEVAREIVTGANSGGVICLFGALAAGKTTFSQGIGLALGVPRMTSPTFVIMRQYAITNHPIIKTLYHLDLYRLESPEDIKAFDLGEIWSDQSNLLLVEWPEKFLDYFPKKRIDVYFKETGLLQREIKIIKH